MLGGREGRERRILERKIDREGKRKRRGWNGWEERWRRKIRKGRWEGRKIDQKNRRV